MPKGIGKGPIDAQKKKMTNFISLYDKKINLKQERPCRMTQDLFFVISIPNCVLFEGEIF